MPLDVTVQIEEEIYTYQPADNGAGPLWCYGSTVVARHGDNVWVAGLETLPDQVPLNNCRFLLYRRDDQGWTLVHRDETGRTREPSPLVLLGDELLVSANPTLAEPGEYGGPAEPAVFRFDATDPTQAPIRETPVWRDAPTFSEHSYRTVVADGREVLYLQNVGYDQAHVSFRDADGQWQGLPPLVWPRGDEYNPPQPLRLCYPNVALRDRSTHFLGVGDIVEPVPAWKEAKHKLTGRDWDYVFRRLFYAYTPDIVEQPFGQWIEIANRDRTAGRTVNSDLHLAQDGIAHILWTEISADHRLRDEFFPDEKITHTLEYQTLKEGQVQTRQTLFTAAEDDGNPVPQWAKFHTLEDGTLLILAQFAGQGTTYRIATADDLDWTDIPFSNPMPGTFLINTTRGGSAPSNYIDLVGTSATTANTLGYARIEITQD